MNGPLPNSISWKYFLFLSKQCTYICELWNLFCITMSGALNKKSYVKRLQCYLIWVSVYFQRRKILWIGSVIVWLKWLFFVLAASLTAWRIILVSHPRLWCEFLNEESGNNPLLYRIQGCYDQTDDPTLFHWEHMKSSPEYCYRSLLWLLQEWQWSENQFIGT